MEFYFVPMQAGYAQRIVSEWHYEGEYAIYDYGRDAGHLLDAGAWGKGLFAVLDGAGELVGSREHRPRASRTRTCRA